MSEEILITFNFSPYLLNPQSRKTIWCSDINLLASYYHATET